MGKKLLLVYSGPISSVILFIDYLIPYFSDIKILSVHNDEEIKSFDIGLDIEKYKDKYLLSCQHTTLETIMSYDIIFGIDHGCIPFLLDIKRDLPVIKVGCQILDYPEHCLDKNSKDYSSYADGLWAYILPHLHKLDFYLCNFSNIENKLKKRYFLNVPSITQTYPARRMQISNFSNENFIIYVGRLEKDKNISHIIESVSLMKNKIKLILVTSGYRNFDYLSLSAYLQVNVEVLKNISDKEKYDLYSHAMCGINLGSSYIPSLCTKEMMSIGKNSIVYGWSEYINIYGKNIIYVEPCNILRVASLLDYYFDHKLEINDHDSDLIAHYNIFLSYESWVNSFLKLIEKI